MIFGLSVIYGIFAVILGVSVFKRNKLEETIKHTYTSSKGDLDSLKVILKKVRRERKLTCIDFFIKFAPILLISAWIIILMFVFFGITKPAVSFVSLIITFLYAIFSWTYEYYNERKKLLSKQSFKNLFFDLLHYSDMISNLKTRIKEKKGSKTIWLKIKRNVNKILGYIALVFCIFYTCLSYIAFKTDSRSLDGWLFASLVILLFCIGITLLTNKMSKLTKLLMALAIGFSISGVITIIINVISILIYHSTKYTLDLKDFLLSVVLPISSSIIGFFLGNNENNDIKKINDKLDEINDKLDKMK